MIASFTNFLTGVRADVSEAFASGYTVDVVDIDANKLVGWKAFASKADAEAYAEACCADVVPAGVFVSV